MSETPAFDALGRKAEPRYDEPNISVLETFANPQAGKDWAVSLDCYEFTSLCPVTGQPDFGRLFIHYVPDQLCVESKSLKLYLMRYRNHGAFHEDCINRIADDLVTVMAPLYLRVFGDFRARGGIAIRPLALRLAPGLAADELGRCRELVAQHDSATAALGGRD